MDGTRHGGLSDIGRWKTLAPARSSQPSAESHIMTGAGALVGYLAAGARSLEEAATQEAWTVDESGLAAAMALVGRLRALVDRVEVTVTEEVMARGTAEATGLSLVDWLVDRQGADAPRPDARRIASVVSVARACSPRESGGDASGRRPEVVRCRCDRRPGSPRSFVT